MCARHEFAFQMYANQKRFVAALIDGLPWLLTLINVWIISFCNLFPNIFFIIETKIKPSDVEKVRSYRA